MESADQDCVAVILKDVQTHISMPRQPTSVVRLGSPIYAELRYFWNHDGPDTKGIRYCFGLHMFLESCKSYLFTAHLPSEYLNCRLQALRFAQEAAPHVEAVLRDSTMPCRCFDTFAYHLENVHKELDRVLHERAFDLYFQSSWVSGSHILEMLESSFYYGLRLISYRALCSCNLSRLKCLTKLYGFGAYVLFPGGISKRNFKASLTQYKGARLRFDPDSHDHKSGNHHMIVLAHTAKATARFDSHKEVKDPRFDYRKVSLFYEIKEKGYHVDDDLWTRVYDLAESGESEPSEERLKQTSMQDRFAQLHKAMLREFRSPFPIAKINIFEVYLACVQIVGIISDKTHEDKHREIHCMCFAEVLLNAADQYKENEHKLHPLGCKELVETCKNAMAQVLGERKLDEFFWKNI